MENDNTIITFTAADIEKYHKGLLTPAEMNALEKAALDDPFLADALEGYAATDTNISADIAELRNRLAEKTEGAKVIAMQAGTKATSFRWLRAAAAVVIVGGVAALANQFIFNPKKEDIAEVTVKKETEKKETVSTKDTVTIKPSVPQNQPVTTTIPTVKPSEKLPPAAGTASQNTEPVTSAPAKVETGAATDTKQQPVFAETKDAELTTWEKITAKTDEKKELVKEEMKSKAPGVPAGEADVVFKDQSDKGITNQQNVAVARKAAYQYKNQQTNIFRGRVTDNNNAGLAFARVYNPADRNAGTYTDANGYFNLTYPDTVLNVQVKALGFENTNIALRNNIPSNRVVLQDDRSMNALVVNNQRANSNARSFDMNKNRSLEEPEPADGWDNYDSYLVNNLNVPVDEYLKQSNSGYVQVSFEVDKNGDPVNIAVDKSLCTKCDAEAIRLIKEGPKWKRSAKKHGRTSVIINF